MSTTREVAQNWNMPLDTTQELFRAFGVFVYNVDMPLTKEQKKLINKGILEMRKQNVQQKKEAASYEKNSDDAFVEEKQNMTFQQEKGKRTKDAKQKLSECAKDYFIFIDTCSLLQEKSAEFLENLMPLLKQYGRKLIMPQRVWEEFEKVVAKKPELKEIHDEVYLILYKMSKENLLSIKGEESDNFADNVFMTQFMKHRINYRLLLITQDKNLAEDILKLNDSKAVKGYPVKVQKVTKYAYLGDVLDNYSVDKNLTFGDPKTDDEYVKFMRKPKNRNFYNKRIFALKTQVTTASTDSIKNVKVPEEGQYVKTENGQKILLKKKFSNGGEGAVYFTDTSFVAKIYFPAQINEFRRLKLERMIANKINHEYICWPEEMLYNTDGEFVGYLMKKAEGIPLEQILGPIYIVEEFPEWKKINLVELAKSIVEKIEYLHQRNVILGDINLNNFLVVDSKTVYLVDTDSYQIEEFPCPVGTLEYIPPELQNKNLKTVLRTMENENFSVATLMFMILMCGKKPYDKQDGGSIQNNLINADFSYPCGPDTNKKTPVGPWRYIWSHFPYFLKAAFYQVFRKGEVHYLPENRYTSHDWKYFMVKYLNQMPNLIENDPQSGELLPTAFKVHKTECRLCKEKVNDRELKDGICQECLKKGESFKCKRCRNRAVYTNYMKYIRKFSKPEYCENCMEERRKIYKKCICRGCGDPFEIMVHQYEDFSKAGRELPNYCKSCREKSSEIYMRKYCIKCGEEFVITYGEMRALRDKGMELPKRCPRCRSRKNQSNQQSPYSYKIAQHGLKNNSLGKQNVDLKDAVQRIDKDRNQYQKSDTGSSIINTFAEIFKDIFG